MVIMTALERFGVRTGVRVDDGKMGPGVNSVSVFFIKMP